MPQAFTAIFVQRGRAGVNDCRAIRHRGAGLPDLGRLLDPVGVARLFQPGLELRPLFLGHVVIRQAHTPIGGDHVRLLLDRGD